MLFRETADRLRRTRQPCIEHAPLERSDIIRPAHAIRGVALRNTGIEGAEERSIATFDARANEDSSPIERSTLLA